MAGGELLMPVIYIVRCNFTDPAQEAAWNAWYSGPKIAQMLAQPYFLSCQRFRRVEGEGRDYLALWTLQSPDALATPEYKAQWGFSEWTPLVTDWSRDLFDADRLPAAIFAVAQAGGLHVISFDGMTPEDAIAARTAMDIPRGMMWFPAIGLDRHTPMIGLRPLSKRMALASESQTPSEGQQAIYRPISEFHRAARQSEAPPAQ
jgi:hypothetical protein